MSYRDEGALAGSCRDQKRPKQLAESRESSPNNPKSTSGGCIDGQEVWYVDLRVWKMIVRKCSMNRRLDDDVGRLRGSKRDLRNLQTSRELVSKILKGLD